MTAFVDAHRETLDRALAAIADRGYWSNYPESPSPRVYGETAAADGLAAYEAHLGRRFELNQPGTVGWVGAERSPFGPELGVTYPQADLDVLLAAAREAMPAWRPPARDGCLLVTATRPCRLPLGVLRRPEAPAVACTG